MSHRDSADEPGTAANRPVKELAIAAPSFDRPSETFIRDHVRMIAPGKTVLICTDDREAGQLHCPVLGAVPSEQPGRDLVTRVVRRSGNLWRTHVNAELRPTDRRRVTAYLAAHGVKVLLAEFANYGVLFPRACHDAGARLFVHAHGYEVSMLLREPAWVRRYRALFRRADGVITASQFLANKLIEIGCPSEKLSVSALGVDCERFRPTARLPFRVLAVGRLVEKKSPQSTIEAFDLATRDLPDARLDLVGEGPLKNECLRTIQRLGLQDRVRLHGAQPSEVVANLMSEASLFVQHSVTGANGDTEGLGVAILEAMASGVPVVSTRHNGIPETVVDGQTGLLVDEHDIEGMAAAMEGLLTDPTRARDMGAAGRQRVLGHYTHGHARDRLRSIMGLPDLPKCQPAT